jgi:hypothetical protein
MAASAANASSFVQTTLSKVTRRTRVSVLIRTFSRRVTPDRVLTSGGTHSEYVVLRSSHNECQACLPSRIVIPVGEGVSMTLVRLKPAAL